MRLNPFKGLPNAKQVWAWGMYDLANQSFTLLIVTLFFAIYFQNTIAPDADTGKRMWGWAIGLSSLVIVVLGPVLGAVADFGGKKKRWLVWMGLGCASLTIALAFTGKGDHWLAFGVFVLANVMFMGGENFLAAFLPEVATRETMSRVSAIGWTMGYLGAMMVLPIAGVIVAVAGTGDMGFSLLFAFAGVWFFANALPTMLFLEERKQPEPLPPGQTVLTIGFSRVAETARQIPRYRELAKFLLAFFVYSCGMSTIIAFSGELAFQYLGAGAIFLVFCWVLSLIAGVGSASTGFWQRRFGQRGVVGLSLVVWIATAVGAAFMPAAGSGAATWPIWLVGAGVGFGLGLTGNASRALVGVFTPAHKTAEFFGMWGLAYKLASVIGPPLYGEMFARFGQGAAMGVVAAFFAVGLALLGLVAVAPGKAAAEEAEREFASGIDDADLAAAARVSREEAESVERARTKPKG
jgi:UMF1 family MFS transporter